MTHQPKSEFLHIMIQRGFAADCTDLEGLDAALLAGTVPAYIGYDATARSLHVGHLLNITMLRWLQKCGHKPLTLMGGGTTRVGDPSFRADERPLLDAEQIDANIAEMQRIFGNYLAYGDGATDAIMLNNADWLNDLNHLDFLREVGRHFSVNRMLSFESVKSRLDRSLSFLEFNYMILQAYDFTELNRRHGCLLQMGGSDQWGNIVNGVDLTRRMADAQVWGLTAPLMTTADGSKMGKTADGAVWLNANMTSPYEFWQFWRNTLDADVGRFLRLYTELPLDEIARLEAAEGAELNEAKKILANEVTASAHGAQAAAASAETAAAVFERGGAGPDLPKAVFSIGDLERTRPEAPAVSAQQMFMKAGLTASGKETKRLFADGGARIDGEQIHDPGRMYGARDFEKPIKLSAGKKRHALAILSR